MMGTKRFLEHQAETLRRFQDGELTKESAHSTSSISGPEPCAGQ